MKKAIFYLLLSLLPLLSFGKDIVFLKDGTKIKCKIDNIEQDVLYYTKKGKIQGFFKSEEVARIKVNARNTRIVKLLNSNLPQNDLCEQGTSDAVNFHKRGGGNFALGFFFGVFGVIGTAVGNPKGPDGAVIPNQENLKDPTYLKCYKKKAKKKNVSNALGGWASIIALVLIASSVGS